MKAGVDSSQLAQEVTLRQCLMHKADKRTIQEYRNKFRLFDTAPHLEENRANSESLSNEIKTRNKL